MSKQDKASKQAGEEAAATVADRNVRAEGPAVDPRKGDPEEIRHDIEEAREALGDTVEALSQKVDVKSQFKAKVEERKAALRQKQEEAKAKGRQLGEQARDRRAPTVGLAAGIVALLLVLVLIRRRK